MKSRGFSSVSVTAFAVAGDDLADQMVSVMNTSTTDAATIKIQSSQADGDVRQARNSVYEQDYHIRVKICQREYRQNVRDLDLNIAHERRFLEKLLHCESDKLPLSKKLFGEKVHPVKPQKKAKKQRAAKKKVKMSKEVDGDMLDEDGKIDETAVAHRVHALLRPKTPLKIRTERLWTALKPYEEGAVALDRSNRDWFLSHVNSVIDSVNERLYNSTPLPPLGNSFLVANAN